MRKHKLFQIIMIILATIVFLLGLTMVSNASETITIDGKHVTGYTIEEVNAMKPTTYCSLGEIVYVKPLSEPNAKGEYDATLARGVFYLTNKECE